MSILITKNTKYLIQGITGKEGRRALKWMCGLSAQVVAGVTPGKGGQEIGGVHNKQGTELPPIPVYNSVSQALELHPDISATAIYVPPQFVLSAAKEAISAEISLIHIIAETVPTKDTAILLDLIREKKEQGIQIQMVGPSSIGLLSPGKSVIGSFGSGKEEGILVPYSERVTVNKSKGGVILLSKSGGMSLTVANMISSAGIALSTVIGLGGDKLIGTTYADLLSLVQSDPDTWALVIIGEIGGSYEEDLAVAIQEQNFSKPVVAFISGKFAEYLPAGVSFGHAGAIVSSTVGTRQGKIDALKKVGVLIADSPTDIVTVLQEIKE